MHRYAPLPRRPHDRSLARDARALHDSPHAVEQLEPVALEMDLDALGRVRPTGVTADHLAALGEDARHGRSRAGETDDQVGPLGEGWSAFHVIDCWYSVKPIAEQTAATIQKRRMIFVSDHASSSK